MKNVDRLYELLPFIHRQRDVEQGLPLKALLRVITEQVNIVEADIDQLYDNWFIETCEEWVVPYLSELVGYEPVHEAGQPGEVTTPQGRERNKILIPRREVANTIRNRRRKGTLALLELLARDVAGWPSRAVEFMTLVNFTQALNHLRPERGRTVNLRQGDALSRVNGPFDELAHTVDVRRPNSLRTTGRYNIPSVGLFVWRLQAYGVTYAPAYNLESASLQAFSFSVLGNETKLYTSWQPEEEPTQIAGELNLPTPIRRGAFEETVTLADGKERKQASANYYGAGKSLTIWARDWPYPGAEQPIPRENILPANLSEWPDCGPDRDRVAVDPEMGRIFFPENQLPEKGVRVSYYYGFPADIGGGEYDRPLVQPNDSPLLHAVDLNHAAGLAAKLKTQQTLLSDYLHDRFSSATQALLDGYNGADPLSEKLQNALLVELNQILQSGSLYDQKRFEGIELRPETKLLRDQNPEDDDLFRFNRMLLEDAYPGEIAKQLVFYRVGEKEAFDCINKALARWKAEKPRNAIIEITDSDAYVERIKIKLEANKSLQIRAANFARPALRCLDYKTAGPDALTLIGAPGARFSIDGLLVAGRGIEVKGELEELNIRHCTLVPGWELHPDCDPKHPAEASLWLINLGVNAGAYVTIQHSILGSIQVTQDEIATDPIHIHLSDSVLDATDDEKEALGAPGSSPAYAFLTVIRSTVIGYIQTHAIQLAENSIFTGLIKVARRQIGCMRFCYVTPGSRTPRRFNCQPDLVEKPFREQLARHEIVEEEMNRAVTNEQMRVRPQYMSTRYGEPDYCRLADTCAVEIKRGADDESEMGVYHDLFQPQREANLRTRLEEYTPAGMNAGIFFAS